MRFTSDGPDIPDYLLQQRDAGNVVFFCGAGISMPFGLPSFEKLTRDIVKELHPAEDSRICKAIKTWDKKDGPTEQSFKEPLDQIFNYLQQEYGRDYIGNLVVKQLSASKDKRAEKSDTRMWQSPINTLTQQNPRELEAHERVIVTSFLKDSLSAQLLFRATPKN